MAIVGSAMFLISSGFHIYQLIKWKSWYFFLLTQGVLMSAASMIARTHSIITLKDTGATGPFIIFTLLDTIAPTMVSRPFPPCGLQILMIKKVVIANMFTMTRIIWWVTPNERRNAATLYSPPHWISFVWVLMFSVPDIGKAVSQQVFKHGNPTGTKIAAICQVLQVFALIGHFLFSLRFMRISRRWLINGGAEDKRWRDLGWTVVAVGGLLVVSFSSSWKLLSKVESNILKQFRFIFSVVALDARTDPKGFYSIHEWMYWATNAIPIFSKAYIFLVVKNYSNSPAVCYALYNFNFPGAFLPREYVGFRLKLKEIEKRKLEAPWPLTISSPIHRSDDKGNVEITLTDLENGRVDRMDGRNYRR
jgi:hypothetical protein